MSTERFESAEGGAVASTGRDARPPVRIRPAALAAMGLAEFIAVMLRFEGLAIGRGIRRITGAGGPAGGDWLTWLFAHASTAAWVALAAVAAAAIFGGRRPPRDPDRAAAPAPAPGRGSWPMLAVHLAALSAFWRLTVDIAEGGAAASEWGGAAVLAWAFSGAAAAVAMAAAAVPPGAWRGLARHGLRAAAVGGAVGLAAAVAGGLAQGLWRPMGRWTLEAVRGLLAMTTTATLVYRPAEFQVGTEAFTVDIAPQCSGYEGIGLVWAFLGAYLWIARRRLRFPRAWLLLPMGTAAIWVANAARITALILVGSWISPEIAANGFHSQAGWLGFLAVALGLVLLAERTRIFRREDGATAASGSAPGPSREAVYLAPMLAIVAAAMIAGAFSPGGLDRLYAARLAAVAVPLWIYRRQYAAMRWSCSWAAPLIGAAVFALWVARWPSGAAGSSARSMAELGGWGPWAAAWLTSRVLGSALTVPIAEELAFRGLLARRLIAADFEAVPPGRSTWTSFVVSSLAFGVLHDRWLEGTIAGMLYALAYDRRGALGDAVAAHATTNALLCADALLTGDWSLFS